MKRYPTYIVFVSRVTGALSVGRRIYGGDSGHEVGRNVFEMGLNTGGVKRFIVSEVGQILRIFLKVGLQNQRINNRPHLHCNKSSL